MLNRQFDPRVLDVSGWEALGLEVMGKKRKRWLVDRDGSEWLFKVPREDARVGRRGEDWAEWVSAGVANGLGLPVPEVRLADAGESRGVVIASFTVDGAELRHGSEVMAGALVGYDRDRRGQHPEYTLHNVVEALRSVPGLGCDDEFHMAVDQWLSYIVFDAVIANTDRHHDNWGLLVSDDGRRRLAPTFDHGTAIGMQLSDDERRARLQDGSVAAWAGRGSARPFAGKPSLLGLAREAMSLMSSVGRESMVVRLENLDLDGIEVAVGGVDRQIMSEAASTFAMKLLRINTGRVQDVSRSVS